MVNKKGFAGDVIIIVVIVFALGIGYFAFNYSFNQAIDQMQNNTVVNSSNATMTALQSTKDSTSQLDYVIFGIFIGLVLALMISAWQLGGYPIFMFIYFLIIVIGVVISAVLANVWNEYTATAIFNSTIDAFPITNHLIIYLPYYVVGVGVLGMIILFTRAYQGE